MCVDAGGANLLLPPPEIVTGPSPAVAAVRLAVRRSLSVVDPQAPIGVACSGGADSLALLAAAVHERGAAGLVTALVVDQAWHPDSAAVTAAAVDTAGHLGALGVALSGPADRNEGAARAARYAVLEAAAADRGLAAVLLGHTRDDQAETVLLALTRGSGARSLAGMAPVRGIYHRPLLDLDRATTVAACAQQGLTPYDDPANADPAFARVRVRDLLTQSLGREVVTGLATTARLLRDDADLLDSLADEAAVRAASGGSGLAVAQLAALPTALRRRLLHRLAPALTYAHVEALDALVTRWRGQGAVALPGGVSAVRRSGRIMVVPSAASPR